MSTRWIIGIAIIITLEIAVTAKDLAACYVAIIGGAIVYLLHTIEFKLNKLLTENDITIWDDEIAKD
jgi:hypothetical protein